MKATGYIETCRGCHSTREIIVDYEMFTGRNGRVFYCFEDKDGKRYAGTRADVEFLIQLLQLRLSWIKEEAAPNLSLMCSKCNLVIPPAGREKWLNQRCGEKLDADDPGCDGIMRPVESPPSGRTTT